MVQGTGDFQPWRSWHTVRIATRRGNGKPQSEYLESDPVSVSVSRSAWIAWQFDCPETGEGMVQAFRRAESVYESARFTLRGLEPDARYVLANLDVPGTTEMTGRELMEKGLLVAVSERPGSAIVVYRKVK